MPESLRELLGPAIAVGMAVGGFLARDWFKARTSGRYMTKTDCEQCRAQCRAEMEKELAAGSRTFGDIRQDFSAMKTGMMGLVLALIPICKMVTKGYDCSELERIAKTLAE